MSIGNYIKNVCSIFNREDKEERELCMIEQEFRQGIDEAKSIRSSVTFYGSARMKEDNEYFKKVYNLAHKISKELGYVVLSGGGWGIMAAANKGAYDAGGESVGLTIRLPHEQQTNPYVTKEIPFNFFFSRQASMSYSTEVCIFCPGGFGTLNELFDLLTLRQTGKIGNVPIVLYGSSFWNPIHEMIKGVLLEKFNTINETDLDLYTVTDSDEKVIEIIKKSKERNGEDALQ